MNHVSVSSSNLASVGYDFARNLLEIAFRNGSVYQYYDVPHHIYEGLMQASSHGRYFDRFIKDAGYTYHRVR
jgi:KTSC domain